MITTYLLLFKEFFITGLLAVGGGLATLPFLEDMSVRHPEWFSLEELGNMVAVSNATPGPLGINMATYVGYTVGGFLGSFIATIALVLPAILVIILVICVFGRFRESAPVQGAFTGLRPASAAMIAFAGFEIFKITIINSEAFSWSDPLGAVSWPGLILALVMVPLVRKTKLPVIIYVAAGAAAGIALNL